VPIPLPDLDDRRFDDLVKEVRALIPRYAPAWTDHNASDPGVTLIELFAWLAEALFYRANRAHESSEARLLELLGAVFEPARPATVSLTVTASAPEGGTFIPRDTVLTATPPDGSKPVKFETASDLELEAVPGKPDLYRGSVRARQMARVTDELLGASNGRPFQRFLLAVPFVVIDDEALFPIVPAVKVNGESWTYQHNLLGSDPDATHFTVDPRTSELYFGNGRPETALAGSGLGKIPPSGAQISVSYRSTLGAWGNVPQGSKFRFDAGFADLDIERDNGLRNGAAAGTDPTSLDAARTQTLDALRMPFRAITADDFERMVLSEPALYLARAKCLPGLNLTAAEADEASVADHVSVIIVPESCSIQSAVFSPDGTRIVTASSEHTARIWDSAGANQLLVLTGHDAPVCSAAYAPHGKHIVTAAEDGTARVWDAASGETLQVLSGHGGPVWSAAYSPDGARIITASEDGTARVWETASGDPLQALSGHGAGVRSAGYSPDGARVVTASEDGTARVWDATTGETLQVLTGHGSPVWSAVYSPDGLRVLTASEDGAARVWDISTGEALQVLRGHEAEVWSADYSPDGAHIVTASKDGTARVWDTATGHPLRMITGHEAGVRSAAYSPDGARIVTASKDGTARVWDAIDGGELRLLSIKDQRPMPTRRDIDDVYEFLDQRRLITCRHHVVAPRYSEVWIEAEVVSESRALLADLKVAIESALVDFFDPLRGGPGADGGGWPFGRDVHASEVCQLIEGVDGVDHLRRLALKTLDGNGNEDEVSERVEIPERDLIHFDPDRSKIEVYGPA
jgi:WD40 repeat protein